MFIVNPGDGHDVETFDIHARAAERCHYWTEHGQPIVDLYSLFDGVFRKVENGNWYEVDRGNLPLKVIALDRAPRPALMTRGSAQSESEGKDG
jgi:hypothetical protein